MTKPSWVCEYCGSDVDVHCLLIEDDPPPKTRSEFCCQKCANRPIGPIIESWSKDEWIKYGGGIDDERSTSKKASGDQQSDWRDGRDVSPREEELGTTEQSE